MKKNSLIVFLLAAILLILDISGISSGVTTPIKENQSTKVENDDGNIFYDVVRVIDGDTIVVSIEGKNQTIRLIGLNTPETVDPRRPVECFGKEASMKAKEALIGKKVALELDVTQSNIDKYGRLLRYVFLEDGINFNKLMIEEGYGHEYTYELPYKYQEEFKLAEKKAREEKRGLWGDGFCS